MKRFILTCGLVLSISTSAMATLYSNQTTTDTGNANASFTPSVAWTTSIPASTVAASNAMLVHATAYASGTAGYMELKLNGQSLGVFDVPVGATVDVELRVTRTLSNQAHVTGIVSDSTSGVYHTQSAYGPVTYVTGLAWTSAQNLTVELSNSVAGGTHFYYGGVQR